MAVSTGVSLSPLPPAVPSASILIIGAGMAGLAAARYLQDRNLPVTLLEGRDRIGGRIWTDASLGAPIDLGAAWIHGIEGNPISALAQSLGVNWQPADFDALELIDLDGHWLTWEEHEQIDRASLELTARLEVLKRGAPLPLSVQSGLESLFPAMCLEDRIRRGLLWTLGSEMEIEYASNAEELSLRYWNEDRDLPGHEVILPQGYEPLIRHLAAGLDIRCGHVVEQIDYRCQPLQIDTNQGRFQAQQVILTLPLGVLKQERVTFLPDLPADKRGAIQRLEMGTLNKVILKFDSPFWPTQIHRFGVLKPTTAETIEFWNYICYVDQPILVALLGGEQARRLETLSQDQILALTMGDLRHLFGSQIPAPVEMRWTRWRSDPFSGGSYSHVAPGAQIEDYDHLAKPIQNRILFAGEATHSTHPCTVHGAYLSGIREAQRLEQILRSGILRLESPAWEGLGWV